MDKVQVMDLTVACQSFPGLPLPEISRDHLLDTIETIFAGDTEVVILEGAEGIGKTTLLAQFVTRHPHHALSLFVRPTSLWAYNPEVLLRDLCNQLQWVLYQRELGPKDQVDEASLRLDVFELRRRARRKGEKYYFVIDGLDEVPEQVRTSIVAMLPFGSFPGFRFLLASCSEQLARSFSGTSSCKPFPLSRFTLDETKKYFRDLEIDQDSIEEIHDSCKGIPGYLASARRILQSGTGVQTLLDQMPNKLPKLFGLEWSKVRVNDEKQQNLLAILAYASRRHTIDDLSSILNLQNEAIKELCQGLGFVMIDPQDHTLRFISEAFRRFAADQLRHLKDHVHDLLISDLLQDPQSDAALAYLPGYLEQRNRFDDLLAYLSPDHFAKLLERSQSLGPLQQKADLGVHTSYELGRDRELIRFSLQKSAILELAGAEIWRSEIEARMAVNDYEAALALAQGTALKEDRLHLLAVIVRAKHKQGLSPEPELIEQIRQLYQQIDPSTLGERAVEIASDLIYVDPTLASELVEKATKATNAGENALDWAFAKLSLAALGEGRTYLQSADAIESIISRIKDPAARQFSTALSLLAGGYSAAAIIAEVEKIEGTKHIVRYWARFWQPPRAGGKENDLRPPFPKPT